jgi:hypothetical protein
MPDSPPVTTATLLSNIVNSPSKGDHRVRQFSQSG